MTHTAEPYENLSKKGIKLIRSLQQKKSRDQEKLFIAEGDKIVGEYIRAAEDNRCSIRYLCATPEWLERNQYQISSSGIIAYRTDYKDLQRISSLVTPQEVLAVIEKDNPVFDPSILKKGVTLVFDGIRDPGNFGTILRTSDWFGIDTVICSEESVDVFNSKVVQSAMGSTLRVDVFYRNLVELLNQASELNIPIFGTFLEGVDLYKGSVPGCCIILFGNESTGIDTDLIKIVNKKITIPEFPEGKRSAESLNLASSVAIITSEIRRRQRESGYSK